MGQLCGFEGKQRTKRTKAEGVKMLTILASDSLPPFLLHMCCILDTK